MIFQCDFKKELKQNKALMDLVKKLPGNGKMEWNGKMFSQSRRKGADSIRRFHELVPNNQQVWDLSNWSPTDLGKSY